MKRISSLSGLAFAFVAMFSVGCASNAAPAANALNAVHECAAPDAYVVSTDTTARGLGAIGGTAIVTPDSRALEGRGVAVSQARSVAARTVANTDQGRGGSASCY